MTRCQNVSRCAIAPVAILFAVLGSLFVASHATATLVLFTGTGPNAGVTGAADITFDDANDKVTVKLTNTTTPTTDAPDLLTGIDFTIGGLSVTTNTLTAKGTQRTVAGDGTFTDSAPNQNLSWSVFTQGGGYRLDFNPDSKDAIIGPPTGGNYSGGNGSIKGNAGHTPFAAEMGTFTFSVPNLAANTPFIVTAFLYGTGPAPAEGITTTSGGIPEPSTAILALIAIVWTGWKLRPSRV